ncbi:uncharacterized protein DFL_001172 [Arthrobotrys flagrans]|uniref:TLC domain-containing protein n=1 Tax=Arthrobotrys flagrans TaxID=97331 RepID=A0A437AGD0_ARTFL|nr:hypothetical protein DFL_001172 [Arthrobotrys flagrans]
MAFSDFAVRHSPENNDPAPISVLSPYSNIILTLSIITLFIVKHAILEPYLPHIYAHMWGPSSDWIKRALLTLHIAALVRVVLIVVGLFPFIALVFGSSKLSDPVDIFGGKVTMGDCLVITMNILPSFYIFEIIHRSRLSIVTWMHHVGSILTAQGTITLVTYGHANARYQFLLITVWGFFDVIMELAPIFALTRLRLVRGNHDHLCFVFKVTALWLFILNNIQSVMVIYLIWMIWDEWVLVFKIITPVLYMAFTATQWHQAYLYMKLMRRELEEKFRKIALKEVEGHPLSPEEEKEKEKEN